MKKVSIIFGFAFLLIFLTSCLNTLHPIFTEKDLAYDPKLIGTWNTENQGNKGKVIISNLATERSIELPGNISSIKQKGYLITYEDKDHEGTKRYIAFLVRIGKHLYFDYFPADKDEQKIDEFFYAHLIKTHTSYRVDIYKDGSFELSQLAEGYVAKLIDEKKIRISHEIYTGDNILITASTSELQQYLIKYSDEPEAYDEKTIFKK